MAALRIVRTARGPVQVQDSGGAEPAVLVVHGMPGDYRQGQTIDEDLRDQARVLRVSRPGYGATPLSSGRTAQASADLYAALLDELDIPDAIVLGISGGGPSSYAFAQRHPDGCRGLVLCCALQAGLMPEKNGSGSGHLVPYQAFRCQDGFMLAGAPNDAAWARFCDALVWPELASEPRFQGNIARVEQRLVLIPMHMV